MSVRHVVKSWSPFFQDIVLGRKKHDLRDNSDRNYKVGDFLLLQEYDPFRGYYTGEEVLTRITYITGRETPCAFSSAVLDRNFVILSLELVK